MTYATRSAPIRAAAAAFADALPAALSAVTGDAWSRGAGGRHEFDGPPEPEFFHRALFRRAGDGFTVSLTVTTYPKSAVVARIVWPCDTAGRSRLLRDAPGQRHSAPEPRASFDPTRNAATVAKQIARTLLSDDTAAAWQAMAEADAAADAAEAGAADWRAAVASASGHSVSVHNNGAGPKVYWQAPAGGDSLRLSSSARQPGGSLTLDLPADPARAAQLVAAIRAAAADPERAQ